MFVASVIHPLYFHPESIASFSGAVDVAAADVDVALVRPRV